MGSPYVLKNCKLYVGGFNLSGDMSKMAVSSGRDAKDKTVFTLSTKISEPGLFENGFSHEGFWQAGDNPDLIDHILWDKMGLADQVMTVCPTDGAQGDPAFVMKTLQAQYAPGASVGEMFNFKVAGKGDDLVRATVMETGAKTVTGNGTARNLGAVSASQKLYCAMHVTAVSGTTPTLNVVIESDDAEAFTTPITRATFTQVTAISAEMLAAVVGPITDTWFRAKCTIAGTTPSFTVLITVGIQ
ncbi:MAG: hypothetical protein WC891_03015 [Actinomycetota bacterium]